MLDVTRAYGLTFIFPAGDTAVGGSLKTYGEFARPEVDFLIDAAKAPGDFIDVGANIGAVALPLARARPDVKVVAIEAHRGLCNILAANAVNNHLYNVERIHAAAGAARAIVDFPAPVLNETANYGAIGFHKPDQRTEPVRMLRLDDIASDAGVIKIDVEGFEPEVLKGAADTLRNVKPVWLVEVSRRQEQTSRETIRVFFEAGYTVHWFFAPFATQAPLKTSAGGQIPLTGDHNVVALPPGHANAWDLKQLDSIGAAWCTAVADFPYLPRYGFS